MNARTPIRREAPDITVVTGANGWFGSALLHALTTPTHPHHRPGIVRALVTSTEGAGSLGPGIEAIVGDVRTPRGLESLFAGVAGGTAGTVDVIHAAGVIHPSTPSEFVEVNVRGTVNVAAAARAAGVRRMVHVSSNSPFGVNPHRLDVFRNDEPYHPYLGYGRSKMLAELRLLEEVERGLDAVIARPPWFYGPHQPTRQTAFLRMVRRGRFPVLGDGRQRRSMVYVDNLVDGVVAAELTDTPAGRGWWIADARPYEIVEIVETVRDALADAGLDVADRRLHLPAVVGRIAERADRVLQAAGRYNAQVHVLGELDKTIACDISVATADLGYHPTTDLATGMRRAVAWCLDRGVAL